MEKSEMDRKKLADSSGISERVLREITGLAEKYALQEVILFGSRARGDHHRTSDIDLAIRGGNETMFSLDVDEYTWTLLKYDIVRLERDLSPALRQEIERDGIVLYEEAR